MSAKFAKFVSRFLFKATRLCASQYSIIDHARARGVVLVQRARFPR